MDRVRGSYQGSVVGVTEVSGILPEWAGSPLILLSMGRVAIF